MTREYLTQSNCYSFGSTQAILVVNTDIILGGTAAFADGCIFEFAGGIIKNGIIAGSVQVVSNSLVQLFDSVEVPDMLNNEVPIEWFGGACLPKIDEMIASYVYSDNALSYAVISNRGRKILFQGGYYLFNRTVTIENSGIILSGTLSQDMIHEFRTAAQPGDIYDAVSSLVFVKEYETTFINITCNGTRLENLLLCEQYDPFTGSECIAVELSSGCMSLFADRCVFQNWSKGIQKDAVINEGNDAGYGLSRCIINECTFYQIKETAIEANTNYITFNIIRNSFFSECGCPIRLVSVSELLQDNTVDNCKFYNVEYSSALYSSYGCCAIYMESGFPYKNYATNNIRRSHFTNIANGIPTGSTMAAAVIGLNSTIVLTDNLFCEVFKYFVIDDVSAISIGDNGIDANITTGNPSSTHDTLVEVIHNSNFDKAMPVSIIYSNSILIPSASLLTNLAHFNGESEQKVKRVKNLYEKNFENNYPPLLHTEP